MTERPMHPGRRALLGGGLALAAAGPAAAQAPQPMRTPAIPPSLTPRAYNATIGLVSGGVDGTYVRIAADLAAVLDDGDRMRVLPILGKGSLQNIADILYQRGVDVGIVQSDVLAYARQTRIFPGLEGRLRYIAKLYDEEVHLLARREIGALEDLAGEPVNLDVVGSGTAMTADLVFRALGLRPEPVHLPQDSALARLRRGEIAAMAYVAGKPARLFATLGAEAERFRLLPVPMNARLLETYLPARLSHADYPGLIPEGETVETVAVGSVLAAFAWQPGTDRHRRVAAFAELLHRRFDQLLQPPRHPKWREVNLNAQVPGWQRFAPVPPRVAQPAPGPRAAR